jgi:hypothetical protein
MREVGQLSRVILVAFALTATACRWSEPQREASITVPLPPARPATPKPSFSFDAANPPTMNEGALPAVRG